MMMAISGGTKPAAISHLPLPAIPCFPSGMKSPVMLMRINIAAKMSEV